MRQSLRIRASLNNLTDLTVPADFAFSLEIKCVSCREVHPTPVVVSRDEEFEISGSRGTANLVWKCGFCKRESSLNVEPAFGKAEEGGEWATLATFEGRGLEIVGFQPGVRWSITASNHYRIDLTWIR